MKICILVWSVYEIDPRVRSYAESFAERGNAVDIICLSPGHREKVPNIYKKNGVTVYEIDKRNNELRIRGYLISLIKFFFQSCYYCTKNTFKKKYDLVHVHSIPDFEVFAAIVPKLFNAKIILDIHDPLPDFFATKFGKKENGFIIKLLKLVERISAKFADHVITVTDHWRDEIRKRSFIPKDKISVIVNYANTNHFNIVQAQDHRAWDFQSQEHQTRDHQKVNKPLTLLYPGTLNKHCGLEVAIKAVNLVRNEIPIKFDIYGYGSEYKNLLQIVKDLEMDDVIYFHDYISWEKIPQLLSNYDVGIALLSGHKEYSQHALNGKIFEFLAMGVPIIVTKTKSTEHYLNDNLVMFSNINDPQDVARCIKALYYDAKKRKFLSENGTKYSYKYNWRTQIEGLFQNIEKM